MYSKVKVAYNNVFRHMFALNKQEHVSAHFVSKNVCTFDVAIRKAVFILMKRIENSQNTVLSSIVNSRFYVLGSGLYTRWKKILFRFE